MPHAEDHEELATVKRELAAVQLDLQQAIESYKAFAYSVSHDLRAPLRAIAGFTSMLEESLSGELTEDNRHLLATVCDNARQMNAQIDALLALSRIEHHELRVERVDMTAIAEAVVRDVQAREPSRTVTVTVGTLAPATGDASLLRIALVELVRNAWKFTRHEAAASVTIDSVTTGNQTTYRVQDNGAGFATALTGRLFAVFQRLHSPKEYEGLGVGLALVKAVANRHHGAVSAESSPGRGASFSISLPAG